MGLLGYLSGDQSQQFQQQMGRNAAGMQQNQMGAQVGMTTTGWQNDYNVANAAQQNAYNWGQFNANQASQATQANNWNALAAALGQYGYRAYGSQQPTANDYSAVNNITNAYQNSRVPASGSPSYDPSTMPSAPYQGQYAGGGMFSGPVYQLAKPPSYGR
jgi:hypothetical protein